VRRAPASAPQRRQGCSYRCPRRIRRRLTCTTDSAARSAACGASSRARRSLPNLEWSAARAYDSEAPRPTSLATARARRACDIRMKELQKFCNEVLPACIQCTLTRCTRDLLSLKLAKLVLNVEPRMHACGFLVLVTFILNFTFNPRRPPRASNVMPRGYGYYSTNMHPNVFI